MPLVVMCGPPGSGKTTRAVALKAFLEAQGHQVQLINEESLRMERNQVYKDAVSEKNLRATFKAAVERGISRDSVVILDSGNYIKGFRYELWCIARTTGTNHCVVECRTDAERCRLWNKTRGRPIPAAADDPHPAAPAAVDADAATTSTAAATAASTAASTPSPDVATVYDAFSDSLIDDLLLRFEAPLEHNRWDRPLFSLLPDDPLPGAEVVTALFHREGAVKAVVSTRLQVVSDTNYLHELDRVTQEMIQAIQAAQQGGNTGEIKLPQSSVALQTHGIVVPLAELRRLKRQFLQLAQARPPAANAIGERFVEYLNSTLQAES